MLRIATAATLLTMAFTPWVHAASRPAVLFVFAGSNSHQSGPAAMRTWNDWLKAGFEIDARGVPDVKTLADLKPFNAVAVNFLPALTGEGKPTPELTRFEKVLDEYLRAGGGVAVYCCGGGGWGPQSPALRHFLKLYGASVPEEQIVDPANVRAHVLDQRMRCNWTTQIADAPMARGIKRIGYIGQASRADVMKQASGMAVYTSEAGRVKDDSHKVFFESSYNAENYVPFAFDRLRSPAEVARAAKGMVNVFTGGTIEDLERYVRGQGRFRVNMFWEAPHHWYLSSGPRLQYNGGRNLHNLAIDQERENLFRYGFKLAGLQRGDEVRLMDGHAVYRRWVASGPQFHSEHTWPHEQTRYFVVHVVRGERTVLLASPVNLNYGRRFNQCGDRQNTLPYNYQPDDDGRWHVTLRPNHALLQGKVQTGRVGAFQSKRVRVGTPGL